MCNAPFIIHVLVSCFYFFFFQAEDGIRDFHVTGVQTCALPISLIRCRARIRGFGRLRLDTSSLILERNQRPVSLSLTTLVAQLPAANRHQQTLLTELLATISNSERLDALRKARHSGDRRNLHGEALDRALHEGHPYHPCFKSRLGFQGDDLVRYSPETSTGFRLHWVAIPRHYL